MSDILFVGGLVFLVVAIVVISVWLAKGRCPNCRKLFAGRVLGSSEIARVDTNDFGYDQQRGEYRNIPVRQTGYLIRRQCRFCEHTWERMESSARQLDRMSEADAKEYRGRKLF